MTSAPPRPPPPPRYEASTRPVALGQGTLSRLDAVLPAVVTIRLRGERPGARQLRLPAAVLGGFGSRRGTNARPSRDRTRQPTTTKSTRWTSRQRRRNRRLRPCLRWPKRESTLVAQGSAALATGPSIDSDPRGEHPTQPVREPSRKTMSPHAEHTAGVFTIRFRAIGSAERS